MKEYIEGNTAEPFDMKSVPLSALPESEESQLLAAQKAEGMLVSTGPAKPIATREENYAEKLSAIPGNTMQFDYFVVDKQYKSGMRKSVLIKVL